MDSIELEAGRTETSATGAVLLLLLMPALAAGVVLSVQLYLGGGIRYGAMVMVASLALFTYATNGLSDGVEDAVNDSVRAAALRSSAVWTLALAVAGMLLSGAVLARDGKFHALYALILAVGIVYSFRLIPHPLGGGRAPVRLKDVPLVKNLCIGATWAGAAFLGPVLDLDAPPDAPGRLLLVGVSYALLVAVNSLFCDIRDERGDRAANVRTLAVRFGAVRCFRGALSVMGVWLVCLWAGYASGALDARHFTFLGMTALGYPAAVWLVGTRLRASRTVTSYLIESADVFFALGLIVLST
jgi:4-hydroxybenzoate polyprenyltransferase